jgi:hypothetical protein
VQVTYPLQTKPGAELGITGSGERRRFGTKMAYTWVASITLLCRVNLRPRIIFVRMVSGQKDTPKQGGGGVLPLDLLIPSKM